MLTDRTSQVKRLYLTVTRRQSHSIQHLCEILSTSAPSAEVPVYTEQVVPHFTLRHKKHEMHNVTVINLSLIRCMIMKNSQPLHTLLSANHSIVLILFMCNTKQFTNLNYSPRKQHAN